MNVVAPGTFAALGVPVRQGRDFADGDMRDRPQVVIVNEALAQGVVRRRRSDWSRALRGYDSKDPMTIVGVVGDVRQYGPAREPQPELYMPYQQHFYNGATLHVVVRGAMPPRCSAPRSPARHASARPTSRCA